MADLLRCILDLFYNMKDGYDWNSTKNALGNLPFWNKFPGWKQRSLANTDKT